MKKQHFSVNINAPKNTVWHALWHDPHYRFWTSAFTEGSHAKSNWQQGSEILFLGPSGDGMYALIEEKEEPNKMVFRHLGEIKNLEKQPGANWQNAIEAYELTEENGQTRVSVAIDIEEEYTAAFEEMFPRALAKLKELAESEALKTITVKTTVNAPPEKCWQVFTSEKHIEKWNQASPDWHCPKAMNNVKEGGSFSYTLAAKDGSFSFNFNGTYTKVVPHNQLNYTIEDGRKVVVLFASHGSQTTVTETFEPETTNSWELQEFGWGAILESFKNYTETQ